MKKLVLALLLLVGWDVSLPAGELPSLRREMQRLGVRTVLLVRSAAIDEHPVWSPASSEIAVNIEGSWRKVDLRNPTLARAEWHGGQPIAVLAEAQMPVIAAREVQTWGGSSRRGSGKVEAKDGTVVEFRQSELGTSLVVTRKGAKKDILWTTSLESCHDLALSPQGFYVALVCEGNGLVVSEVR